MTADLSVIDGYLVVRAATATRPRLRPVHWRAIAIDNAAGVQHNWLAYDTRRHRPVVVLGELTSALAQAFECVDARLIAHGPGRSTYLVPRSPKLRAGSDRERVYPSTCLRPASSRAGLHHPNR